MKALILPIKPVYANRIINGTKKFEFRRRLAKRHIEKIFIYCTFPSKKIVASVKVLNKISDTPSALWIKTKHSAGISKVEYNKYFSGCKIANAYELGEVEIFSNHMDLTDFGISATPQSYIYVDIEEAS